MVVDRETTSAKNEMLIKTTGAAAQARLKKLHSTPSRGSALLSSKLRPGHVALKCHRPCCSCAGLNFLSSHIMHR